tara:strand:+ start:13790 stop:16840 length:3051 start_codon:yes stop_codon:yes gene_type:complete
MSFIPLKSINFVNTKVELKNEKTFISGSAKCNNLADLGITTPGISGSLYDINDFSKSIININLLNNLISEIDYSNVSNQNKVNYLVKLNSMVFNDFSVSYSDIDSINSMFNVFGILDTIKEDILSTSSAADNNFTLDFYNANKYLNNFNIKKIIPKYSYDDYHLKKKNILKNNTYKFYRHNKDYGNLSSINWGFNNYNTLNFFSQRFSSSKTHSNCISYPNLKIDSLLTTDENVYNFINNDDFNISFYINKRKEKSLDNTGCIIHIPGLISVYLKDGTNTNIKGDIKSYKLGYVLGEETYKNINSGGTVVNYSNDNIILANSWHHVSLNFNKINNNTASIILFIDGVFNSSNKITDINFTDLSKINSYITIGNKPKYLNSNNSNERQRFFAQCFTQHLSNTNDINGPYFEKHIEFNGLGTYDIDTTINSISNSDRILFEDNINNSEALNCEIHDIRIYKNSKSNSEIEKILETGIENISNENDLDFYLPVFFVPSKIRKKSLYTASNVTRHLKHTSIINPFFANFCGGYEVSLENFCIEFTKKISPNIIIGGSDFNNIINSNLSSSVNNLIDYTKLNSDNNFYDFQRIRKGETVNKIYLDNLVNSNRRNDNDEACNLVYVNNMILPNDNGLQTQKYDLIKNTFSLSNENLKFYEIENNVIKYNHVNVEKFINDEEYVSINFYINNNDIEYQGNKTRINTDDKNNYFEWGGERNDIGRNDNIYNIDALTYHIPYTNAEFTSNNYNNLIFNNTFYVDKINSLNTNVSSEVLSLYSEGKINNIYTYTESNIIKKDYKNSNVNIDEVSSQIDTKSTIYGNPVNNQVYNKFILPYNDFNKDYFYPTNIIEVPAQFYNKKIIKESFELEDVDLLGSNGKLSIKIKDNGNGCLYRSDCNTKVATWNYLGHIFYNEGLSVIHHPGLENLGYSNFKVKLESDNNLFVNEINIPCESGMINESFNSTYNKDLRSSESAFDSDESFVYITDINLHDENLNIIAKAKLAHPVPKKNSDNILFRLKMDY